MNMFIDTITAVATPPGVGGIAIIRVSGPEALAIAKKLCPTINNFVPRVIQTGDIISPKTNELIDNACIIYFESPYSFTGEHVIEFHLHGGALIQKQCLSAILGEGARLAKKGEFTKQGFINGKIDLCSAESINDIIHAKTSDAKAVALNHQKGKLNQTIQEVRAALMTSIQDIEATLDFPDEVPAPTNQKLLRLLDTQIETLHTIISTKDFGSHIMGGINCIIIGAPNAGKSTLMNQLVGEDRVIVSDTPGTTRDYIETNIELGGLLFKLIDTAGFRDAQNKIESMGIQKALPLIESADLILWVIDQTQKSQPENPLTPIISKLNSPIIICINKSDLSSKQKELPKINNAKALKISAKTGEGISKLKEMVITLFKSETTPKNLDLICNARQMSCIETAHSQLTNAKENLQNGTLLDAITIDFKQAIKDLGEITGQEITEEILDGIFSRFCIGK